MKAVIITGANSYIGTSLEKSLSIEKDSYSVKVVDLKNPLWRMEKFFGYSTVVHLAGLAHVKETAKNKADFYSINRDLAIEVAQKAKTEGVKHFVYISSMSVYGMENGRINKETLPNPKSVYGLSKLQGEQGILALSDTSFHVAILRPPMVYGKGCKGNYQALSRFARLIKYFPATNNERSMIHIDNLCIYMKWIINMEKIGVVLPQNLEYVNTSEMVKLIAAQHGRSIRLIWVPTGLFKRIPIDSLKKLFNTLVYEKEQDNPASFVDFIGFEDSIRRTESI